MHCTKTAMVPRCTRWARRSTVVTWRAPKGKRWPHYTFVDAQHYSSYMLGKERERVLVVTGWAPKSKRWLHQTSVDLVCAVSFGPSSPGVCACWLVSCGVALLIVLVGLFCAGGFAVCRLVCFIASCSIWCLMTRLGIVLWCLTCFGAGWLVLRVTCAKKAFLGGWRVVGEGPGGRPSCCSNTRHLHGMFE